MDILKWYSIALIGTGTICNLYLYFKKKEMTKFLSFLFLVPVLTYLIAGR
jgi:hypothetical protein